MSKSKSSGNSIGLFGVLGVLFIGLKLADVIDWSWWLVLLPIYGPAIAAFVIIGGLFAFAANKAGK